MSTARTNTDPRRRAELALIHTAKRALGLEDDQYRDLLEAWTGKRSAGVLSPAQRQAVIEYLRKMGFAARQSGEPRRKPASTPVQKVTMEAGDAPQVRKIKAQWLGLHLLGAVKNPSLQSLDAFVKRVCGIDRLAWTRPAHQQKLIEVLKRWTERVQSS